MTQTKIKHNGNEEGFSIIEILASLCIFFILIVIIGAFQVSIFKSQKVYESRADTDQRVIRILRNFTQELRSAQNSNMGGYLINYATSTELVFFSDLGNDDLIDRVRYSLNGTTLERGIIEPSGGPLTYNLNNERTSSLIYNITNTDEIFTYYGSEFEGADPQPLSIPFEQQNIRMVRLELEIDSGIKNVKSVTASTDVTIRNLRGN